MDAQVNPEADPAVHLLRPTQRRSLKAALVRLEETSRGEREASTCGVVLTWTSRLGRRGERCRNPAGLNTPNAGDAEEAGFGPCWVHGGAKLRGRAEAGWLMAHKFAQELDCSPWEGLLRAVRISAGKVAYTQWVLSQATDDLELEGRFARDEGGLLVHPDNGEPLGVGEMRDRSWWVAKNELWVDRLARYSKAAIDAGVAERLVELEQAHAAQLATVLNGVLEALESDGVEDTVLLMMRGAMREQLMALDTAARSGAGVIEGETV